MVTGPFPWVKRRGVVLNTRNLLAPAWEWVGAVPPPAPYAFPDLS
jgi:hypothetical protein